VHFIVLQLISETSRELLQWPDGWENFEDEVCLKLLNQLEPNEHALGFCQLGDTKSTVVSIKSRAKQNFIEDNFLHFSGQTGNVWTGEKRVGSTNNFHWQDGTSLDSPGYFINWAAGSPHPSQAKVAFNWIRTPDSGKMSVALRQPTSYAKKNSSGTWIN
jgi:hypothetical protein